MRAGLLGCGAGVALGLAACTGGGGALGAPPRSPVATATRAAPAPVGSGAEPAGSSAPAAKGGAAAADPLARSIAETLARAARARQLGVARPVVGVRLDREQVLALIMAKAKREIPDAALQAQGELLRVFGLIARRYDFVGGMYGLLQTNVAGLYDDDTERMVMLDDLSPLVEKQTLAHELVHALQHQHYDLDKLLKYRAGQSDRVAAGHALAEGDATSAMLDLTAGSAFSFSPRALRLMMISSVALSGDGATVPRVLQSALVAAYADGFAFVQALRRRGGWREVDRAWRRLPVSTEQLLHLDKYDAAELPLPMSDVALPFGEGWQRMDGDVLGEQGLRLVLEQWTHNAEARRAAAGWGADRYLVAVRRPTPTALELAAAWHLRFDSPADAREVVAVVRRRFGPSCRRRADLGPMSWLAARADLVLVGGPYRRVHDGAPQAAGGCAEALRWARAVLASG